MRRCAAARLQRALTSASRGPRPRSPRHSCLAVATRAGFRIFNTEARAPCRARAQPSRAAARPLCFSVPRWPCLQAPGSHALLRAQTGECCYEERGGAIRHAPARARLVCAPVRRCVARALDLGQGSVLGYSPGQLHTLALRARSAPHASQPRLGDAASLAQRSARPQPQRPRNPKRLHALARHCLLLLTRALSLLPLQPG
jgi:hypothetical protein